MSMQPHTCPVTGCRSTSHSNPVMCSKCWVYVPKRLRRRADDAWVKVLASSQRVSAATRLGICDRQLSEQLAEARAAYDAAKVEAIVAVEQKRGAA